MIRGGLNFVLDENSNFLKKYHKICILHYLLTIIIFIFMVDFEMLNMIYLLRIIFYIIMLDKEFFFFKKRIIYVDIMGDEIF